MRIVRIDQIAPGGAPLEAHPRLTVLRGASPELRRRLLATLRSIAGGGVPVESGIIEVSGVQLSLDPTTIAQLRIEGTYDPVLELAAHRPAAPVSTSTSTPPPLPPPSPPRSASRRVPGEQAPDPFPFVDHLPPRVEVVSDDEADLRAQLREVNSARTELGLRMDSARGGLDSFSTAALEVCLGQIDALELRRASLRVDWEHERDQRRSQLDAASAQLAALRSLVDRVGAVTATAPTARSVSTRLSATLTRSAAPDPAAQRHAAQLDAAAARVRDLTEQRDGVQTRLGQMAAELDRARAEADSARRDARSTPVDRSVVQRLEAVRDEIFAVDERQSVLGAARNKRRVMELRSEEAILLDRMGFDTYSAYVMGIPTVRAELDRASRAEAAIERIAALEAESERLVEVDTPAVHSALAEAAEQLHRLVVEALRILGGDTSAVSSTSADAGGVPDASRLADEVHSGRAGANLVHRISVALWDHRLIDHSDLDAALADAAHVLGEVDPVAGSLPDAGPEGPVAIADLPAPPPLPAVDAGLSPSVDAPVPDRHGALVPDRHGASDSPDREVERAQLLGGLDRWLGWLDQLERWITSTETVVVQLELVVAGRAEGDDTQRVERWAQVEAELDEALDRLALAQERVRAHEEATAALAGLRTEELDLRDRERGLLAKISSVEAATVPPKPPAPPAPPLVPTFRPAVPPAPPAVPPGSPVGDPAATEWLLISRLARQRSVSFVGSLPLAVDGLPDEPAALERILPRLDRMSDLVQIVVLSDDDAVAAWATGLGERGRLIRA